LGSGMSAKRNGACFLYLSTTKAFIITSKLKSRKVSCSEEG
jgi:hypothetical protein